jgi:hypothetical protein
MVNDRLPVTYHFCCAILVRTLTLLPSSGNDMPRLWVFFDMSPGQSCNFAHSASRRDMILLEQSWNWLLGQGSSGTKPIHNQKWGKVSFNMFQYYRPCLLLSILSILLWFPVLTSNFAPGSFRSFLFLLFRRLWWWNVTPIRMTGSDMFFVYQKQALLIIEWTSCFWNPCDKHGLQFGIYISPVILARVTSWAMVKTRFSFPSKGKVNEFSQGFCCTLYVRNHWWLDDLFAHVRNDIHTGYNP